MCTCLFVNCYVPFADDLSAEEMEASVKSAEETKPILPLVLDVVSAARIFFFRAVPPCVAFF